MNSKIIASVIGLVVLVGAGGYYYMSINRAQANADYTCTQNTYNAECKISNYDSCEWTNGLGKCNGAYANDKTYTTTEYRCSNRNYTKYENTPKLGQACQVENVPAPQTTTNTDTTAGTGSSDGYVESETASGDTNTGSAQ